MGFDLGSLLGVAGAGASGAARGLGNYSQIQFAERLRQLAQQQQFDQRRQLAEEGFGREKELRLLLAELSREAGLESEQRALTGQAEQALGAARGMGLPGNLDVDPAIMGSSGLNDLIGQLAAASGITQSAQAEREEAPEIRRQARLDEATLGLREAQTGAANRSNRTGGGSAFTPVQRHNIYNGERNRLMAEKQAAIKQVVDLGAQISAEDRDSWLQKIEARYADLEGEAQAYADRATGAVSGPESGLDIDGIATDEASKFGAGERGIQSGYAPPVPGLPTESQIPVKTVPKPAPGGRRVPDISLPSMENFSPGGPYRGAIENVQRNYEIAKEFFLPDQFQEPPELWTGEFLETPVGMAVQDPSNPEVFLVRTERGYHAIGMDPTFYQRITGRGR